MEDDLFLSATKQLLREILEGPPSGDGYILNPGDAGLLGQIEEIDAATASLKPTGRTSIAAHVDHVMYGISLLNRWAAGEKNPFADADWEASWKRDWVDEMQWRDLRNRFREQVNNWKSAVDQRSDFDPVSAAGTIASVAHTAYHLGAIRQILAATRK